MQVLGLSNPICNGSIFVRLRGRCNDVVRDVMNDCLAAEENSLERQGRGQEDKLSVMKLYCSNSNETIYLSLRAGSVSVI
jgi:hypothetical protein